MKNSFKLFAAALAFVGFAGTASAQNGGNSASATGTAVARIIEPITLAATDGLINFGTIVSDADGGYVSVFPNNWGLAPQYDGISALSGIYSGTQTPTPGHFSVSGEPWFHYIISMPPSITMTSGDGSTMTCALYNPFHEVIDENIINGVGFDSFTVGGQLQVGADQQNGFYSGTFTCTVSYE